MSSRIEIIEFEIYKFNPIEFDSFPDMFQGLVFPDLFENISFKHYSIKDTELVIAV